MVGKKLIKMSLSHLVIIPDGNRRWARKRGLPPWSGHIEGAKRLEEIVKRVWELKIPYFTFWTASRDNLTKRSQKEVQVLFSIFKDYFSRLLREKKVYEEGVQINFLGKWKEVCPKDIKGIINELIEKTKSHNQYFLTFLLAYNGIDEMVEGIRKIAMAYRKKEFKITEEIIAKYLWTNFLPSVDLIIRTGCEDDPHNSTGFMMWKTAYSQFYFTRTFFPDFSTSELDMAIENFLKRERRFGA